MEVVTDTGKGCLRMLVRRDNCRRGVEVHDKTSKWTRVGFDNWV